MGAANPDVSVNPDDLPKIEQAHRCESLPDLNSHLPYASIGAMWGDLAKRYPDKTWMIYYGCEHDDEKPQRYTDGEFAALIDRVAAVLSRRFGIQKGSAVATI